MELSKRLKAVADLVSAGSVVCDAGCDHGYVPIYLVRSGICRRAIASDVKEGPLSCARENIGAFGLEEYIETRLSDGVSALEAGEADALILAGMGGRLVIKILTEGRTVVRSMRELILQPQSDIALVRAFLREEGYRIVSEDMVYEDGKYYPMMKAMIGEGVKTAAGAGGEDVLRRQAFDRYGGYLLAHRHPVLRQFLLWEQERERAILQSLTADTLQNQEDAAGTEDTARRGESADTLQRSYEDAPDRNARRVQELLAAEQVRAYALSYYAECGAEEP